MGFGLEMLSPVRTIFSFGEDETAQKYLVLSVAFETSLTLLKLVPWTFNSRRLPSAAGTGLPSRARQSVHLLRT